MLRPVDSENTQIFLNRKQYPIVRRLVRKKPFEG